MTDEQETIEILLDELSEEERIEVFHMYCTYCGEKNPRCNCMRCD